MNNEELKEDQAPRKAEETEAIREVAPQTGAVKERPRGRAGTVLIALAVSLVVSAAAVFTYHCCFAPKIVAMDVIGYVSAQKVLFLNGKITEEQFKASMDKFENKLNSLGDNNIVLRADAVLKGVKLIEP
ncbi:MAG: hypothetical protein ACE14T_03920 [Syntrophales bacterium]